MQKFKFYLREKIRQGYNTKEMQILIIVVSRLRSSYYACQQSYVDLAADQWVASLNMKMFPIVSCTNIPNFILLINAPSNSFLIQL